MISAATLRAAERAYQDAPRGCGEQPRLERRRLVAVATRSTDEHGIPWTHARLAAELGKSAGWVGQLLAGGKEKAATTTDETRTR